MRKYALILMGTLIMTGCARSRYPVAPSDGTVDTYFGTEVEDPFRPLEDDMSKATQKWVKQENRVTRKYLSKIPFRKNILERLTQVADYEKMGAPVRHGDKFYYSRNTGLQNQSVIYQCDAPGQQGKVFLDPNTLSSDGTVALKGLYFSNNGRWAAYVISRSGSDWEEIYVIDLSTGEQTSDHIEWAKFTGAAWKGDGFYYSAYDRPSGGHDFSAVNEGHKIYYHKVGTSQSEDTLFYENKDYPRRFYTIDINTDESMAFLDESGEGVGNVLYVKDLSKEDASFVKMTPDDFENTYYPVETYGDSILIMTNREAPSFRLMQARLSTPMYVAWKDVVPQKEDVLESVWPLGKDRLVLAYSHDASSRAFVYSLDGKMLRKVDLPGIGSVAFSCKKEGPECFYTFTSFTVPGDIYAYDPESGESKPYYSPKTSFDASAYKTEQVFFSSKDGTKIPMFMTSRKDLPRDSQTPVLLYGYGGFDISLPPSFVYHIIPFLEQGGIYVQVNLRGGGEYGEQWHLAGTKMNKQNVFDDFIAAAEYLIGEGYTTPQRIAIMGGSNGGLLVGACMTQRPDLYAVAIPMVGVMDMLRYHKFTIGWNWAGDYGTSEDSEEMFQYLKGYSPLHNITSGVEYPATLVTTADHDDRVVPAHSFKFAATLQKCNPDGEPALIRIDTSAGHGGGKPLSKRLQEYADIYAFMMKNLGMEWNAAK